MKNLRASSAIALLFPVLTSIGCAGASETTSQSSPARSSGGAMTTTSEAAAPDGASENASGAAQTRTPSVEYNVSDTATTGASTTVTGTQPGTQPVQMLSRDDQIAQWQTRLAASEQVFNASAGVCSTVCRATDSICHASRELCALTGDREGAPPTDPRCARARASCERAARQRQESCTSCPAE